MWSITLAAEIGHRNALEIYRTDHTILYIDHALCFDKHVMTCMPVIGALSVAYAAL